MAGGGCQLGAKGRWCCLGKQRGGDLHPISLLSILLQPVSIVTRYLPFPMALPAPDSHSQHHPPEAEGLKQQQQPHNLGACVGAKGSACCSVEALECACVLHFGVQMLLPAATPVCKYMDIPGPAGFWHRQKLVRPIKVPGRFVFCPGSGIPPGLRHWCLLMEVGGAWKKLSRFC